MSNLSELRRQHSTAASSELDRLLSSPVRAFDPDAYHAMQARDDQLIADSVLHGYAGTEYVYQFTIQGKPIEGISVIGARALAAQYKGIQARIVSSVEKTGSLFVAKCFDPPSIHPQVIDELEGHDDYYEVVMEIRDVKTGNSIHVRKKETKTERRRDGSTYERPHYDVVAESKAFRNGVLAIIPQDVVKRFKEKAIAAGSGSQQRTKPQMIDGLLNHALKLKVKLSRQRLNEMTYAELSALASTAKDAAALRAYAESAGVIDIPPAGMDPETGEIRDREPGEDG